MTNNKELRSIRIFILRRVEFPINLRLARQIDIISMQFREQLCISTLRTHFFIKLQSLQYIKMR